jgi:hypothetical protein
MEVDGPSKEDFDYDAELDKAYAFLADENEPRPGPAAPTASQDSSRSTSPSEWGRSPSPEDNPLGPDGLSARERASIAGLRPWAAAAPGNALGFLPPDASTSTFAELPSSPAASASANFLSESYQLPQEQAAQASQDEESGEGSLFGISPSGSSLDPRHSLALPNAADSMTRLPGASFPPGSGPGGSGAASGREASASLLNASRRYNPYGNSALSWGGERFGRDKSSGSS